ncbi:MAG: SPFH domain-containing protein [Planctomycetota bacterium]
MFSSIVLLAQGPTADFVRAWLDWLASLGLMASVAITSPILYWLMFRYIPNNKVGVVEKLWSFNGSLCEGNIVALEGEAGLQADLLRGGLHFGFWRWQYRVHKAPLVTIPQGKMGYVYSRDGDALSPNQTLARVVDCENFQDARAFLTTPEDGIRGQRGRQRAILREGVYAINPAIFVVITDDAVFSLEAISDSQERQLLSTWRTQLQEVEGFHPVVVGKPLVFSDPLNPDHSMNVDGIGLVTVHDGISLNPGEIIAPSVGMEPTEPNYHNNFQDPEAFLRAGGKRGRQYVPLTDGTYFINRWFATVEMIPKTVVPIGYVGVVVSYYGQVGRDISGDAFRHGERVAEGQRGVWQKPLGPGKYAFNTLAGSIVLVPTTNFVLHWVTGKSESHRYDESLRSIDLVTKDAYEPLLPLSVVVHIDYQRAPSVIQRFGDVKKLITQTLDPMLSAYFRDIAHRKTMLELLHERDLIQKEARDELRRKFGEFDIECVDVLIGKPSPNEGDHKIEDLLEQLRQRQLSHEQLETYARQTAAAEKLRMLNEAQAHATMQTQLTNSRVQVQIVENQGEAELARSRKQAEQTVVLAEAELARSRRQAEQTVLLAEADGQKQKISGRGEGQRVMQVGLSEAAVLLRKISSFGDPRLFTLSMVAEHLAHSEQPLVPERLFVAGQNGDAQSQLGNGMLGMLLSLLVAEKSGFQPPDAAEIHGLQSLADRFSEDALASLKETPCP